MANNQEPMQVCSLPLPPQQYFHNYSDENIRRGRAPKPPPLIQETYTMFGNPYNAEDSIIRPLESQVCLSFFLLKLEIPSDQPGQSYLDLVKLIKFIKFTYPN